MVWFPLVSRKLVWITVAVILCVSVVATESGAQVYGAWANPQPLAPGTYTASGFLLGGEPIGLMGQLRYGISEVADLGVQLGIPDFDTVDFSINGDFRYLMKERDASFPMNVALDGAFGLILFEGPAKLIDFEFGGVLSNEINTASGMTLYPYGALMIAIGRVSAGKQTVAGPFGQPIETGGGSDTDVDVHFRGGMAIPFEAVEIIAELNLSSRSEFIYVSFGASFALGG